MPFLVTDDINALILQYLRESGFVHAAFAFAHETHLTNSLADTLREPLRSMRLVELIQKGCYFRELEACVEQMNKDEKKILRMSDLCKKTIENLKPETAENKPSEKLEKIEKGDKNIYHSHNNINNVINSNVSTVSSNFPFNLPISTVNSSISHTLVKNTPDTPNFTNISTFTPNSTNLSSNSHISSNLYTVPHNLNNLTHTLAVSSVNSHINTHINQNISTNINHTQNITNTPNSINLHDKNNCLPDKNDFNTFPAPKHKKEIKNDISINDNFDYDYYKNGFKDPAYTELNSVGIGLNHTHDRINDFCWGSDIDLVTAHDNGTCLCWIIEKTNSGINSRIVHIVEGPKLGPVPQILRVEHISHTVNYCCVTSLGTIKVFSYYETLCEYKATGAPITSLATWCDPKISNESFAAVCSVDGTCVLRRGIQLENVQCIQNFNDSIIDSSWSKGGILALSALDGSLSMLNPINQSPPIATNVRKGQITCHSWSHINEYLAVASYFYITIYKRLSIDSPFEITCHKKEVMSLQWVVKDNLDILFSVDSDSFLFYHTYDQKNHIWISRCIKLFSMNIKCMELAQHENYFLMVGGQDGGLLILDFIKKSIYKCYKLQNEIIEIKSSRSGNIAFRFGNGQILIIHSVNIF